VSRQEIFQHKVAFATGERFTAGTARNRTVHGLRAGFGLDYLEHLAMQVNDGKEAGWPPSMTCPKLNA